MEILYHDEDITVSIEFLYLIEGYLIHTKVRKWSLSKYKKYLNIYGYILNLLIDRGITRLFALPPSKKEQKWEELFGFKDTGTRINNYVLMEYKYGN
jgi:hypothetical protein